MFPEALAVTCSSRLADYLSKTPLSLMLTRPDLNEQTTYRHL